MGNWADRLVIQYEEGRKDLQRMNNKLGDSDFDKTEKSKVNSMISSMTYSIDWMKVGRDPHIVRGIDIKKAYQKKAVGNMDLFPASLMQDETDFSRESRQMIMDILMSLSTRERECFLMHKAYMMSFAEIGKELQLSRSTVQKYVERAKNKLSCRANVMQCS